MGAILALTLRLRTSNSTLRTGVRKLILNRNSINCIYKNIQHDEDETARTNQRAARAKWSRINSATQRVTSLSLSVAEGAVVEVILSGSIEE